MRIEVWDTGLGIPADRQRAVFEEFQRLDQGARVARGLGLGLSIVERLGRVLDHPVGLSSWPGEGSVFSVDRAARRSRARRASPRTGAPPPALAGEPLSGLKVLAIDNEPRVLDGMRRAAEPMGLRVATAHGLAEARAALAGFGAARRHHRRLSSRRGRRHRGDPRAARGSAAERMPAILATADRSLEARDAAAREDIVILNKPLKPAPLRAQLARFSAMREAAE